MSNIPPQYNLPPTRSQLAEKGLKNFKQGFIGFVIALLLTIILYKPHRIGGQSYLFNLAGSGALIAFIQTFRGLYGWFKNKS